MIHGNIQPDKYGTELLLVLPVCLAESSDGLLFESQASNGIERWLENFSTMLVLCPVLSADDVRKSYGTVWKPVSAIAGGERVTFQTLPYAMSLKAFTRAYRRGRATIRQAIEESRYLCFAIGGLFGDWGAVACLEAQRLSRPYAVWTDAVLHKFSLTNPSGNPLRRMKDRVRSRLMYSLERRCIRHASLGLFHGATCYAEYAPWCRTSYVVHDVHAKVTDAISSDQLEEKYHQLALTGPLKVIYVGRAEAIKGPFEWIAVLQQLRARGVKFQATWLGDGPCLPEMRQEVARLGLSDEVSLPGFVGDRAEVLGKIRGADVFVFCHKTPESPRSLVEALISGCPIVGYHSDFAAELVADGGGAFVTIGDKESLAERVCALAANRSELVSLTRQAALSGKRFNDVAVFRHRSDLIKAHLS